MMGMGIPLISIIALTLVVLAISVWAMVTQESDPTFQSESSGSWDGTDDVLTPVQTRKRA